jgi:TolB-like protein/tetratricopeptide (TPR) repeat protein
LSLFKELKRRNVFRVAIGYTISCWLLAQVADLVLDAISAPEWVLQAMLLFMALGFPVVVFFSWAYEVTPQGIKKESEVDRSESITHHTGRKLNMAIVAVLIIALGFLLVDKVFLRHKTIRANSAAEVVDANSRSVAVLPFIAMSSGEDDGYFADGLTEEIINSLTQLQELLVTARTSAFAFKGQDTPITDIARTLGVAHVVEGSVRRSGDQLRITAQLIRAEDGFHLWSETYDRSATESFEVQAEIATRVAEALDVVLSEEQVAQMRSSGIRDPAAFVAYQKGVELYDAAHDVSGFDQVTGLLKANEQFARTIELEPEFSTAYFHSADYFVHFIRDVEDIPETSSNHVDEALQSAIELLEKAVRNASNEGQKLTAQLELIMVKEDWRRMSSLLAEAAHSNECFRISWWGSLQTVIGKPEQSLAMWDRLVACDPLFYSNWAELTDTHVAMGNFEESIKHGSRGMEHTPHLQIVIGLVHAYMATNQYEKAISLVNRYIDDERQRRSFDLVWAAMKGDRSEALAIFNELLEAHGEENTPIEHYALIGDREGANRRAATLDARPLGFLKIFDEIDHCFCGKPFDLEAAPNYARMIEETNGSWPPPQPIEWPLKDW